MKYQDLTRRSVKGLKHIGSFTHCAGIDPHPLDCSLAGRVCHVFGVGMHIAIEIIRDAGEDPDYRESHCLSCDALVDRSELDEVGFCNDCVINANHSRVSSEGEDFDEDDEDE